MYNGRFESTFDDDGESLATPFLFLPFARLLLPDGKTCCRVLLLRSNTEAPLAINVVVGRLASTTSSSDRGGLDFFHEYLPHQLGEALVYIEGSFCGHPNC
jgi:hypothetical protein